MGAIILNSELVNNIRLAFVALTKKYAHDDIRIDDTSFSGLTLEIEEEGCIFHGDFRYMINGVYFDSDEGSVGEKLETEEGNELVAEVLIYAIFGEGQFANDLDDLLHGISSGITLDSGIGLSVNYTKDIYHQVLFVRETEGAKREILALEECVNANISIGPKLLTTGSQLHAKVFKTMGDFILANLSTIPVDIESRQSRF